MDRTPEFLMAAMLVLGILLAVNGVHVVIWLTVIVGGFAYSWHLMKKCGRGITLRYGNT